MMATRKSAGLLSRPRCHLWLHARGPLLGQPASLAVAKRAGPEVARPARARCRADRGPPAGRGRSESEREWPPPAPR